MSPQVYFTYQNWGCSSCTSIGAQKAALVAAVCAMLHVPQGGGGGGGLGAGGGCFLPPPPPGGGVVVFELSGAPPGLRGLDRWTRRFHNLKKGK